MRVSYNTQSIIESQLVIARYVPPDAASSTVCGSIKD